MEKPSLLRRKSLSLKGTLTRLLGSEQQQQEPEQAEQGPKSPLVASSPPQLPELQLNTPPPPATSPALSSASSGSIREVTAVLKDDPCDVAMADDGFSVSPPPPYRNRSQTLTNALSTAGRHRGQGQC